MEGTGMLVVSLEGVNFGFRSHLGVFWAKRHYIYLSRSKLGLHSFRGQRSLGHAHIGVL